MVFQDSQHRIDYLADIFNHFAYRSLSEGRLSGIGIVLILFENDYIHSHFLKPTGRSAFIMSRTYRIELIFNSIREVIRSDQEEKGRAFKLV